MSNAAKNEVLSSFGETINNSLAEMDHKKLAKHDRAEKRLRKSMSCGNDCGLSRGFIQNGGLFAGK